MKGYTSNLTFLGNKLNSELEWEFFADNGLGFSVKIKFTDGKTQTFNNITEFHWRFKSHDKPSVALESDIHSTGGTRDIERIETCEVTLEKNIQEHW